MRTEQFNLCQKAVNYMLIRLREDPRLAYLIGPGSETFERLMAAGAALAGEDEDPFTEAYRSKLHIQSVPSIGATGAVVDDELLKRIAAYDQDVHDIFDQADLNMLVNHFVRRGLEVAEGERDTQTGEMF